MPAKPLPAYTNPFRDSPSRQTDVSARRSSDALDPRATTPAQLDVDVLDDSSSAPALLPVPNAPGAMAPIHTHNYPWSREPSSFSPTDVDSAATPAHGSSTPFSFSTGASAAAASGAAGQMSNAFESTNHGFNTAQYTSISAGSPPPHKDDRGPSPTRRLRGSENDTNNDGEATMNNTGGRRKNSHAFRRHNKSVRHHHHASGHPPPTTNIFRRMSDGTRRFGAKLKHMDPVKLAYLRTSFVFAISVLVTWTPSSINRVYTLIYPDKASYGLNIAAAVVLPLQGVWNAVIYFTTSWKIFREEMEATRAGRRLFRFLRLHTPLGGRHRSGIMSMTNHGGGGGSSIHADGTGGLALGSSAPRSEMGRNRRLDDMDANSGHDGDDMEMQSPLSSPQIPQRRMQPVRASTMRVTQKQFDDFS